jgi:hypothetical protein
MIGRSAPRSSWLPDLAVPVALVVAEAGWVSLLVRARIVGTHHVDIDLPFLAVAVPGILATLASVWLKRLRLRRWAKRVVIAFTVAVGLTACAGVISGLSVPGSQWIVATHPWASTGHRAATIAGAAWVIAGLAWVRGIWLGSVPVSFRHALWSFTLASAAFLGVFIGHADSPHGHFAATTSDAGWLFFVTFPLTAAAVALVRQRDLEEEVLAKGASRPGVVWVSVLAVPMAVVAAVGLALALAGGPAAPVVGRFVGSGARILGRGIEAVLSWLPGLNLKLQTSKLPAARTTKQGVRAVKPGTTSPVLVDIGLAVLGVLAIGLLILIVYLVKRFWPKRGPDTSAEAGDDEEDSVFSWAHLWAQLRGVLSRLRPRRRRPRRAGAVASVASGRVDPGPAPTPDGVREAYRRMLIEARTLGAPRARAETTLELEARFRLAIEEPAAASFHQLTDIYDEVRYGEADVGVAVDLRAGADVDVVVGALRSALAPPAPASDVAAVARRAASSAPRRPSDSARSRSGLLWRLGRRLRLRR